MDSKMRSSFNWLLLARLRAGKSQLNELLIFESIQDQQAVGRLLEGHRDVKLGFRSCFQAKVVTRSFAQVFFDDGALLIHLHRIDTHVRALILKFTNRFAESALKLAHLRSDQLWEAQQNGGRNPSTGEVFNDLFKVRRSAIALSRADDQIAFAIYVKVTRAPV